MQIAVVGMSRRAVVGQRHRAGHRRGRLGHGAAAELGHLLVADAVEVLACRELILLRQWLLDALELLVERGLRRSRVDVDHVRDVVGAAIGRRVARRARATVNGEYSRLTSRGDRASQIA